MVFDDLLSLINETLVLPDPDPETLMIKVLRMERIIRPVWKMIYFH